MNLGPRRRIDSPFEIQSALQPLINAFHSTNPNQMGFSTSAIEHAFITSSNYFRQLSLNTQSRSQPQRNRRYAWMMHPFNLSRATWRCRVIAGHFKDPILSNTENRRHSNVTKLSSVQQKSTPPQSSSDIEKQSSLVSHSRHVQTTLSFLAHTPKTSSQNHISNQKQAYSNQNPKIGPSTQNHTPTTNSNTTSTQNHISNQKQVYSNQTPKIGPSTQNRIPTSQTLSNQSTQEPQDQLIQIQRQLRILRAENDTLRDKVARLETTKLTQSQLISSLKREMNLK